MKSKIVEKLKKSELIRRVYVSTFGSYERQWNLHARGRRSAIWGILNVEDEETFDKRGGSLQKNLRSSLTLIRSCLTWDVVLGEWKSFWLLIVRKFMV